MKLSVVATPIVIPRLRLVRVPAAIACAVAVLLAPGTGAGAAGPTPAGHAFLEQHCLDCHDDVSASGGLNLADLTLDADDPVSLGKWAKVRDRVAAGEMPPVQGPAGTERPRRVRPADRGHPGRRLGRPLPDTRPGRRAAT